MRTLIATSRLFVDHLGWKIFPSKSGVFARLILEVAVGFAVFLLVNYRRDFSYMAVAPQTFQTRYSAGVYWVTFLLALGSTSYFIGVLTVRILGKGSNRLTRKI